jgi:hypothetical protein
MEILLLNLIKSMLFSKAQDLAAEHIDQAIDDNMDASQKEALDEVIRVSGETVAGNFKEFMK